MPCRLAGLERERHPTKVGMPARPASSMKRAMRPEQIVLLRTSFAAMDRYHHVAALVFYRRLFELDPSLRPLFRNDIEEQARKLMDMLGFALSMLENRAALTAELERLGARHIRYGVRDEHYATVGRALLDMLSEVLGPAFTLDARMAWTDLFTFVAATMQRGAAASARHWQTGNSVAG
jgi:hemoglobin-like flavoprotein